MNEPFALTLAGETIYVVTSPQDASEIARNTSTVSLEQFAKQMYTWTGVSAEKINRMWESPSADKKALNPQAQPAHEMLSEYHRQQLIPGNKHSAMLSKRVSEGIDHALKFENLRRHHASSPGEGSSSFKISLWNLCTQLFIEGIAEAYLGHLIWKIHPNLLRPSMQWESSSWKYIYQLPSFLSQDMRTAKAELVDAFIQYFKSAKADRADGSFFVAAFEQELRECGFDDADVAQIFMLHYWA